MKSEEKRKRIEEIKYFKGIKSKEIAINTIKNYSEAIEHFKKLEQTEEVKRGINYWNNIINDCKNAIAYFELEELKSEAQDEII